jgi:hypothetical protein
MHEQALGDPHRVHPRHLAHAAPPALTVWGHEVESSNLSGPTMKWLGAAALSGALPPFARDEPSRYS